jgi:uncharacterized damage-inducible protein DinB
MPESTLEVIVSPPEYASREAGSFMAQLDDLSKRLAEHLEGATADELAWQPEPGMNTIGMLLEHNAIVEVFWTQVGPLGLSSYAPDDVLGVDMDHDGIPLPAGGAPPEWLRGKETAYYQDLLAKARAYAKAAARPLTDADLDRTVSRTRRNGVHETLNLRWILYHMVEHFAGHYYQIKTLRHFYRLRHPAAH